ncbi:TnsA-like heteromeric transposase endonuclease subunit [Actinokineospora cianjurensis]|uniref:TnsA-like heteromeric transposase endonuclease subunit n=1 Tax=Actinokineospora cianjurensis TaxID=585224 RepID=UPI00248316A5|nr:TnsA-like heteromeric transposase endonuclease subunit [Actinokineospora cianjurensis]
MLFEGCRPVRGFPSYKGQRHFSGWWWSATSLSLVGYESWLERDTLMMLDFDPLVVGVASQPFWLFWATEGKPRSHVPDFFARLADGSARVLDCRPAVRVKQRDRAAFEATRDACAVLGWRYEVVDAWPETLVGNVRWLAGYRHPRHGVPAVAEELRAVCSAPVGLLDLAESVGDPIAVLPVLFHLLWRQELLVDLSVPLRPETVVSPSAGVAW